MIETIYTFFQSLPLHTCILLLMGLPLIAWLVDYAIHEAKRARRRKRLALQQSARLRAEAVVNREYTIHDRRAYEAAENRQGALEGERRAA